MRALLEKHGIQWNGQLPRNQQELGALLVKHYNIHKEQLSDCSICHR
jgi:late competence protein required for DNA uptake (superfamily II DNA/RNA helicase)